ncbi:MAG TPA: tetratricopeptide repeat protein [Crocinitomix sp.]|nr:tetratricopeptide repeat protein [Crocinitomix sp.]
MCRLKYFVISIFFVLPFLGTAQESEKYTTEYANYYRAEELFEKQKYSASQKEYELFFEQMTDVNHPFYIKAKYYYALNALYLYQYEAEKLLLTYITDYPETIYKENIYFQLGRHYYRKRKYKKAVEWFTKMEKYNLSEEEKNEYNFKLGYAYFRLDQSTLARNAFYEVIDKGSKYSDPALYYYSHIAYTNKDYQVALDGFLKLNENPAFSKTVPYYIAQIYYLQGNYEKVTKYAPNLANKKDAKYSLGMNQLIGDAFYKVKKYDEAVPFLEEYNRKSATTRDEDYQLGYAYFMSGDYSNAIRMFDKVAKERDKLGQTALYHIGQAYLKQNNHLYARNAFELASNLDFDEEIEQDALYNYAVLSYKLDYNPYDEAVEALNRYLKKYPNSKRNKDIYQYLINVYTTMKNYKSAIELIDEIPNKNIRIKSAYQMMAYNYGVELFQNGAYDKAIDVFKLVKKYPIDPSLNAKSMYWIAEAYFAKADYPNAISWYRKFIEESGSYLLKEHNDAYYNIAYAYFKQEDWENAIQSFRTFTQDNSETHKEKITDAYLRIGDSYYKNANDEQAIKFYNKAIDTQGGQEDYAKYQIGKSYGYLEKYEDKAKSMLDIVNNYPKSTFTVPALYEVGEAYRLMEGLNDDKAIKYYKQLVRDYPQHTLVKDAVFQIGILYFRNKQYAKAEKQFLKILDEFNDQTKKKEALARLKDVYTALNQPEKYTALMDKYNINFDEGAKDTLYFENAYDLYSDSSYVQAVKAFEKYLNNFPNPIFELEALFFKGNAHIILEEDGNAIVEFEKLLQKPQNRFTERASAFASKYEYEKGNYNKAIEYYQKLLQSASYPQNKLIASIGLMRSYALINEFTSAKPFAEKVLKDEQALDYVKTEAHYVIAKAYMSNNNYTDALTHFKIVSSESDGEIGAESQFNVALIYHLQEDYSTSEEEVRKMMKSHASYGYWIAKALILQTKNSMAIEDYVQAEYTLNSVINGYTIQDDGILEEANEVMAVLQEVKNKEKEVQDNTESTIEINEGGN